ADSDQSADVRKWLPAGTVRTFRDDVGRNRLLIVIRKTVDQPITGNEGQYLIKIGVLLHEIGHVRDFVFNRQAKFLRDPRGAFLASELSAERYALEVCRRQGYVLTFQTQAEWGRYSGDTESTLSKYFQVLFENLERECDLIPPLGWFEYERR